MRAPSAVLAIPLVAGSAAGLLFFELDRMPICAAAGALVALCAGLAAYLLDQPKDCLTSIVAGAFCAGLALGARAAQEAYTPSLLTWFHHQQTASAVTSLEGRLLEDAARTPFGVSLSIEVSRIAPLDRADRATEQVDGGVRLSVAGTLAARRMHEWRAGRTVRVNASLREPAVYLTPGVPDDRRTLARRGIVLVGSVKSGTLVDVINHGSTLSEAAGSCRAWARLGLARFIGRWSVRSGGIATAILLGDRTGLGDEDERKLQQAGTYHVIAISGGNIAILTAILIGGFRLMRLPPRWSSGASIVVLLFYGAVVAPAPSVRRAIAAASIYLAARLFDQRGPAINVLGTAAVLAVGVSPLTAFDPGFILSFGATVGILVFLPRFMAVASFRVRFARLAVGLVAATVAAELVLAPVSAAFFSRITFAGLVLNLAAIPLMSIVQAGSLFVLASGVLHPSSAEHAGYFVHVSAWSLLESAKLVDFAPWVSRDVAPPGWWLLVLYYAALIGATFVSRVRRPAAIAAGIAGLVICSGSAITARNSVPGPRAGTLRVAFLDVGQGDATLLQLPDGRSLLVDAGGFPIPALQEGESGHPAAFDIGSRVVAPALRALGVRRLDTLVLTHGDPDHVGGALSIVRLFRPRAIWEGVPVPPHRDLNALAAAAVFHGAERRLVLAGDVLYAGGIRISVAHPPLPDWERQRVRNEDSVVLEISYGAVTFVLPGDIGSEGERMALNHLARTRILVLKAPHHGSASSSTAAFLAALRPTVVIFSAGRANRFGHPASSVVARYRQLGAEMFSTAEDGTVIAETDGRSVQIRGWKGKKLILK